MTFSQLTLGDLAPKLRKQVRRLRRPHVARIRKRELEARRLILSTRPAHVSLEMTTRCNLECVHCRRFHFREEYSETRAVFGEQAVTDVVGSSGYMAPEVFERCLDLVRDADSVELAGYGEPMMNPRFFDFAKLLKGRGLHINTITNGTLLTDSNIKKLIDDRFDLLSISIDGLEKETLRVVRGLDSDVLYSNIERLNLAKEARGLGRGDAPRLSVSFCMARFNIREMPGLVRRLVDLGLFSFYAQNLEVVNAPDTLGPHLLHTDPAVRAEAARIVEETKAICRQNGVACDIQRIPHAGEGWEPPGVSLDEAFEALVRVAKKRDGLKRAYRPLAEIETERARMSAAFAAEGQSNASAAGVLPQQQTADHVRLSASHQRENERCLDFFRYAFVAWNGKVLSCCFERHAVGDLNLQSAEEVWNGEKYQNLRRAYFEDGIRSVCDGCSKILD